MKALKKSKTLLCALAAVLALAGAGIPAFSTKAAEVYSVEVVPCYQHPVTGVEEVHGQRYVLTCAGKYRPHTKDKEADARR